jgi:protocatechuate 3,4-dioxygenase beta subunit
MATMDKKNDNSETSTKIDRRDALTALGAIGPLLLLGCSSSDTAVTGVADASGEDATGDTSATSDTGATTSGDAGACHEIPDETGGPYPDVDGMISNATYKRQNIAEGLQGTPLTLTLQVLDVSKGCAPIVGARVIIWHCDANGVYSEYASTMNSDQAQDDIGTTTTTYLRGWQVTDSNGRVTFTTIYPGWYLPRVTHIHVMVYNPSDLSTPVKTTQFAFPDATNGSVYDQATLYPKGQNSTTNATDQVFGSSEEYLVAAVTGNATSGYAASLPVGLESY